MDTSELFKQVRLLESATDDKSTLTKEERDELPDEDFAVPELRKFPINDKEHVTSARAYFKWVPAKYKKKAADRIFDRMVEYEMKLTSGSGQWVYYLSADRKKIISHQPPLKFDEIEFIDNKWVIKDDKK